MTTHWGLLLHFYQPPTQTHDILRKVADESYRPILRMLETHPHARVTVHINGVLTDLLAEHGHGDVLASMRRLAEQGVVEFSGGGRFHPILPLIPSGHRKRSIREQVEVNRRHFGASWRPKGFFPPEMCIDHGTLEDIAATGHRWTIMSGVASPDGWAQETVHRVEGLPEHAVIFRDDVRSNRISFRETSALQFIGDLASLSHDGRERYVVTAMDAETFGHHVHGWEQEFLGAAIVAAEHNGVEMLHISEIVERYPPGPAVTPRPSSWSTTSDDLRDGDPYPLWHGKGNAVHAEQWELAGHAIALVGSATRHAPDSSFTRLADERLQPALHSCQFWWASRRPQWDEKMILGGLGLLSEVLVYAGRALHFAELPAARAEEVKWRLAAADELRLRLSRRLITGAA